MPSGDQEIPPRQTIAGITRRHHPRGIRLDRRLRLEARRGYNRYLDPWRILRAPWREWVIVLTVHGVGPWWQRSRDDRPGPIPAADPAPAPGPCRPHTPPPASASHDPE